MTDSNDEGNRATGCCARFLAEFTMPQFSFDDPNGRTIDVERSFCTTRAWATVGLKFVLWGLVASVLATGWIRTLHPHFFMAYVSNWTLAYSLIYQSLSLLTSSCCSSNLFVKLTWAAYSVAVVHSIIIVIMFWVTEYSPENYKLTYYIIMCHAGTFVIVLLDGWVINKVPVRLKHIFFNLLMAILYLAWSLAQAFVPVDNPYQEKENEDIYSVLQWKENTTAAIIVYAVLMFVACPIFQTLFWALSLCGRRYILDETVTQHRKGDFVDETEAHNEKELDP